MKVKLLMLFRCFLLLFIFIAQQSFAQLVVSAGDAKTICSGDTVSVGGASSATGGTPPYVYSWSPSTSVDNRSTANPSVFPIFTTSYTLTVTDAALAFASESVTITVTQLPNMLVSGDTTINAGEAITLSAEGASSYQWSPVQDIEFENTANPEVSPSDTITYYVDGTTLGCVNRQQVQVNVTPVPVVKIFNTFTPNEDGINDVFYIQDIERFPDNSLKIFNRYGKIVFEMNGYDNSWTGRGFGEPLPSSVYYYILDLGDGSDVLRGSVTIIGVYKE